MASGKRLTTDEFIERAKNVHNNFYAYPNNLIYKNYYEKVPITCPIHGEFWQKPSEHLRGKGCKICGMQKSIINGRKTFEWFENQSNFVHRNKYVYHKETYKDVKTKTLITCPIHGDFWQTLDKHLHSQEGCPRCAHTWMPTTDEIIEKCRIIHGDKYDYEKLSYVNAKTKVTITCKKHGDFLQDIHHHLDGNGCPKCRSSKLENELEFLLKKENIIYEQWKRFDWLKNEKKLSLDFYLPQYNCAIECQGEQHYRPINWFGGIDNFLVQTNRDEIKKQLCKEHGIRLLYFTKYRINNDDTFTDVNELLQNIRINING